MNPRSAAKDKAKTASDKTPFEQISIVEEKEEARLQQTLAGLEQELRDGERAVKLSEETEENKLKEAAREEVRMFAATEPASILQRFHSDTEGEIARIDAAYRKHGKETAQKLAASILDFSFLSRS